MLPEFLTKTSTTKTGKKESHLQWWVTLIMSLALAIGTWNPIGNHFIHYISSSDNLLSGFKPFGILIMLALWLLAIKSIFQSLKLYGALLTVVIITAFIWGLQEYGIIDINKFSIIWKKLTGVYTTDMTEEE